MTKEIELKTWRIISDTDEKYCEEKKLLEELMNKSNMFQLINKTFDVSLIYRKYDDEKEVSFTVCIKMDDDEIIKAFAPFIARAEKIETRSSDADMLKYFK